MVISPWKALLFIAGGVVAAATAGYVTGAFDGVLRRSPPVVAALPENAGQVPDVAEPALPQAPVVETGEIAAPEAGGEPAAPADTAKVSPPRFDVLRVETDGSVVIAGRSAPEADVEIINGTSVIGKTLATAGGDFAVVLDEPLPPGDYQIVLRSTTRNNVAATSVETALVSVPDSPNGEVLALVEEPGKPSKLITVPEGEPKATLSAEAGTTYAEESDQDAGVGNAEIADAADKKTPTGDEATTVSQGSEAVETPAGNGGGPGAAGNEAAAATDGDGTTDRAGTKVAVLVKPAPAESGGGTGQAAAPALTATTETGGDAAGPTPASTGEEIGGPSAEREGQTGGAASAKSSAEGAGEVPVGQTDAPVEKIVQSQGTATSPGPLPSAAAQELATAPQGSVTAQAPAGGETGSPSTDGQAAVAAAAEFCGHFGSARVGSRRERRRRGARRRSTDTRHRQGTRRGGNHGS